MKINSRIELLNLESRDGKEIISFPPLSDEEKEIINPIVPPTSGIRMKIYEKQNKSYVMSKRAQFMFLRVFKAVSEISKKEIKKINPGVLLVSDDRPSANYLMGYFSKILASDGYKIYYQKPTGSKAELEAKDEPFYSRMSTPYGSASVLLYDEIDLVIVLTASHNDILWNGVKFYIERPMPISGKVMQRISNRALDLNDISLVSDFSAKYIDADKKNNDYIINIAQNILDLSILKGRKIILWSYMGTAPEIQDLFERLGVKVILIDEQMEPPNPTVNINHQKIEKLMIQEDVKIAILLDSDRDRLVIIHHNKETGEFKTLLPNTLYPAMHNILINKFNQKIINVRTIPSDPRSDKYSKLNFVTGVGYKHLGMILYSAIGRNIDNDKFQSSILYVETPQGYKKIGSPEEIQKIILDSNINGDNILFVMWEESGGHTINILQITHNENDIIITPKYPAIGDKYPAEAILIISTLIEMGYDLSEFVDQQILGSRTMISGDDKRKMKILNAFAKMKDQIFSINNRNYKIGTFEQVDGKISIIHLWNENSNIYFRPSGTGPGVRIYYFGPETEAASELSEVKEKIEDMF
ncbi:MAG: hypothetical protein ACTSQ5_09225 [Promethearchaeota archaeon]